MKQVYATNPSAGNFRLGPFTAVSLLVLIGYPYSRAQPFFCLLCAMAWRGILACSAPYLCRANLFVLFAVSGMLRGERKGIV